MTPSRTVCALPWPPQPRCAFGWRADFSMLQAVVGLTGTALAAVAFISVGNAISGGSVPVDFPPGGLRQIAPWLPNSALVRATRDVGYFHGHDLAHPVLVLGLWPAIAWAFWWP